jgi:8-amino-7-oxononanoate synthase
MARTDVSEAQGIAARLGHDAAVPERLGSPGILDRAERFSRGVERAIGRAANPFGMVVDSMSTAVEAMIDGRPTLMFGTNSYLGLNFHPACISAAIDATQRFGTGSTASRVAGGNSASHVALETELAKFYARRHAVVFSTGFMANLGVISALVRRGDAVLLDAHCHASIIDAAKLSGGEVRFFAHNDAADLQRLLQASTIPASRTLVVVEGLYSVTGDLAELADILSVAKRHGAVTMVDEAHALGVYGEHGRGVVEQMAVEHLADIIVGTFSKSVGVVGGYSVSDLDQLRGLRVMARPYLYTASLPPAVVATARESLRLIETDISLRERLWNNSEHLRSGLARAGVQLSGHGPIGRIAFPMEQGAAAWSALLTKGIYVNLLVPPATPDGEVALRLSVSAAHTPENIECAIVAVAALFQRD